VKLLFILFFLFSCNEPKIESFYLPEKLPSEAVLKEALSSDKNLVKLRQVAQTKGLVLESWKDLEKGKVSEKDIGLYFRQEKQSRSSEILDTDGIDRQRESIRKRIVWSRLLKEAGIAWKESSSMPVYDLLSKLNLKNSPNIGVAKARWVIVEWSDFLCTFCKQTYPHTKKILEDYKGKVHYYHKDFPLDTDSEEGLLPLAQGRCLWDQTPNTYEKDIESLYKSGKFAMPAGGDFPAACAPQKLAGKYFDRVKADYLEATSMGIVSIPTFWVNGRWIKGALDEIAWKRILTETASP
jgi:hypothetical protein